MTRSSAWARLAGVLWCLLLVGPADAPMAGLMLILALLIFVEWMAFATWKHWL